MKTKVKILGWSTCLSLAGAVPAWGYSAAPDFDDLYLSQICEAKPSSPLSDDRELYVYIYARANRSAQGLLDFRVGKLFPDPMNGKNQWSMIANLIVSSSMLETPSSLEFKREATLQLNLGPNPFQKSTLQVAMTGAAGSELRSFLKKGWQLPANGKIVLNCEATP